MEFKFEDFVQLAKDKKEIRHSTEEVCGENIHIFHYMVTSPDLFKNEIERECRGISFLGTGGCVCRPYNKFFNIGEREETLPQNLDWDNIGPVTIKADGSLVTPVEINGQIFWKTKKTFFSNIAIDLNEKWSKKGSFWKKYYDLIHSNDHKEYTLLFEYVSLGNRIVLKYDKEELIYLGKRNIITGEYIINPDIIVETVPNKEDAPTWCYNRFIERVKDEKEIEGYVLYSKDGLSAWKIKTQWYVDRHHLLSSISYKTILKMIGEETIDDIIAELRIMGFVDQAKLVEDVYKEYSDEWSELHLDMYELYSFIVKGQHLTKKEFAVKVLGSYKFYQGPLFSLYDNNDERIAQEVEKIVLEKLREKYKTKVIFLGEVQ